MRPLAFLLLTALTLVLMAGETDAEKEPLWSRGVGGEVYSVAISADGEYIASGDSNSELLLFNKDATSWAYTNSGAETVAISANGEYVVAGFNDNSVCLFETVSNEPLWSYDTGKIVISVAISADGKYITAGTMYGGIYLFEKDSSTPLWDYEVESADNVLSVAISADGEYITAGSDKVYLFDKDNSAPLWSQSTGKMVQTVAISADGQYIPAGDGSNIHLFARNIDDGALWDYDIGNLVYSVAISADGKYIAAGSSDNAVWLFYNDGTPGGDDVTDKGPLWIYDGEDDVLSVDISADGEYIAAGSNGGGKIYLFDKDLDEPLWNYPTGHDVQSVAISADGKYITAGAGSVLYLFDKTVPELVVEEDEEEQTDEEAIEEWKAFWFPIQMAILAVLASLLYVRRETGYENPFNKIVKVFLYGISILLLLGSLLVLILAGIILILIDAPEEMRNPGWMWLLFAIIFALVGSFLGHESNGYSSSYQSPRSSSIPSSRPIFANRPAVPMFKPENETTPIECPGCGAQMQVPKLGTMQTVTCKSCGISGEIEI